MSIILVIYHLSIDDPIDKVKNDFNIKYMDLLVLVIVNSRLKKKFKNLGNSRVFTKSADLSVFKSLGCDNGDEQRLSCIALKL